MKKLSLLMILLVIFLVGCQKEIPTPIIEVNEKPTPLVTISTDTIQVGTEVTLDASESQDPEGDELRYKWDLLAIPRDSGLDASFLTQQAKVNFTPDYPGYYIVSLFVNDGVQNSDPLLLKLYVEGEEAGDAISVEQGSYQTIGATLGQLVSLDVSKVYADNETLDLNFSWTLVDQPVGSQVVLPENAKEIIEFTPDVWGTYLLSLVVDDGQNISETIAFSIFAKDQIANLKKAVSAGNMTISWTTHLPSTSVIRYGTSSYDMSLESVDSNLVTEHSLTLSNLEVGKTYYYNIYSYTEAGNEIGISYGYNDYQYESFYIYPDSTILNLQGVVEDLIYDQNTNQVYALDELNKELLIIDVAKREIIARHPLKYQPAHFCLAEDRNVLYIANYGSNYVTEFDLTTQTMTREIEWRAPFSNADIQITYQAPDQLYIKDSYNDGLWMMDLTTLAYLDGTSNISDLGKFVFSQDGNTLYTWKKTATSTYSLAKYDVSAGDVTTWTSTAQQEHTMEDYNNLPSIPIFIDEVQGTLYVGDLAININDLSLKEDLSFVVRDMDQERRLLFSRLNLYDLDTHELLGNISSSYSTKGVVNANGNVLILGEEFDSDTYEYLTTMKFVPLDTVLN